MAEFQIPSFLQHMSVDEIHQKMKDKVPKNIDMSDGSHPWNLTRPTAYIAAYFAEYILPEAIKTIFPKYAENYADLMMDHAELRGLVRKAAAYATGEITITGASGTEIPAGSLFSTASINGEPSVEFITTEDGEIGESGTVTIPIKALEPGIIGNVAAGTIIMNASAITGISSVTNESDITGGTAEESIEDLQQRIIDYDSSQGVSYVGSEADYKRWALEVEGTGSAVIISPTDDTGLVTIVLTDANGDPANETLRTAVYNHIIRPDAPEERLAPINGGNITVVAPQTLNITISVIIKISSTKPLSTIKESILAALKTYMIEASEDQVVRYTKIGSIISKTDGVEDYKSLLLNGGTENISITNRQLPSIDEENLTITTGTV